MPPKLDKPVTVTEGAQKLQPPNIFIYIQLAKWGATPELDYPLEIHLAQGGSLIVKCVEHYNTEGIILQDEFNTKPTYTLILQQDNIDHFNQAVDNPLLIKLYMRKTIEPSYGEEEDLNLDLDLEAGTSQLLNFLQNNADENLNEIDKQEHSEPYVEMILLSVGFLDLIKLFGHERCMLHEELFLYPVPECPMDLRFTVHTEWHLYTLVPIAKEMTFTNLVFITLESIYGLKEEYMINVDTVNVQLSFRSTLPVDRQEYHVIPWCSFTKCDQLLIEQQHKCHVFQYFRNQVDGASCCPGLRSPMSLQMHLLFYHLMRSENMDVDFKLIDESDDHALIFNTFHRFILTHKLSNILFAAFVQKRYVIAVDVFHIDTFEKKIGKLVVKETGNQKIFSGILDPAILLFPGVQSIRFAVELKYLGTKKKKSTTRSRGESIMSRNTYSSRTSVWKDSAVPSFAIIQVCMLAPLGEVYKELKVFRESFINQNRLLYCRSHLPDRKPKLLWDIQREAYARFDKFMRSTIRFIVDKKVRCVEEKSAFFCCALQNLSNILLKVVGCDFNQREKTTNSLEFTNLCAVAYNELEIRIHDLLENIENEGLDELIADNKQKDEILMDYMNTIKFLNTIGDTQMAEYFYDMIKVSNTNHDFEFYDLIAKMERGEYVSANIYFETTRLLCPIHEYFACWIRVYLDYIATRDDPDPLTAANATECLLNSITMNAQVNRQHLDGWILLYCYYKRFGYAPGYSFARWHFENKLQQSRASSTPVPFSLFGLSMNLHPYIEHIRGQRFFESFTMFVHLGLYEFGQVIFDELKHDCQIPESYMIDTQLKILLNQLNKDFVVKTFDFKGRTEEELMVCYNAQLNGNVEYYRGNKEKAAEFYAITLERSETTSPVRDNFMLSRLRLAYLSFEAGDYQKTIDALHHPIVGKLLSLATSYLSGKAYYKLNEQDKAMQCFINCTKYKTHVPNVWGFLALINLQMGNNSNALSCWKYARIDPTKTITDEAIFEELDLINVDNVDLYIDIRSPTNSETSVDN